MYHHHQQQQQQQHQQQQPQHTATMDDRHEILHPPFSEVERFVMEALLLESPLTPHHSLTNKKMWPPNDERRFLSAEMLFSAPPELLQQLNHHSDVPLETSNKTAIGVGLKRPAVIKKPKDYRWQVGLWHAHEDGVAPRQLTKMASVVSATSECQNEELEEQGQDSTIEKMLDRKQHRKNNNSNNDVDSKMGSNEEEWNMDSTATSADSEEEIRDDDNQSGFSLDSHCEHFDAWQVLKDEYSTDFGFDYTPGRTYKEEEENASSEEERLQHHNTFRIIGTSGNDKAAYPHVLSPPIMERLLSYVPEYLQGQNFWMRYSLIRDGASLDTFKAYARAAKDSILAIETTRGEVFGVYTSNPWKTNPTAFGGPPSFVWRMKSSRLQPCHSLFEQAEMESQIDVYEADMASVGRLQMLVHDRLGVGIGNMNQYDAQGNVVESEKEEEERNGKNYGFAIALEDDLLSGTSSRSPSYRNPCLVDPSSNGEPFQTLNCELWTLTPAFSLESAEKLEMTQFFVSESMRSSSSRGGAGNSSLRLSSRDLDQHSFYRRIGQGDEHEELRSQWQRQRLMEGGG